MQITVTFRHVDPTPALRDYAEDKADAWRAEVPAPSGRRARHPGRLQGAPHGRDHARRPTTSSMFAKETTHDLYSAIDLAVEKLEHQAQKLKARRGAQGRQERRAQPAPSDERCAEPRHARRPRVSSRRRWRIGEADLRRGCAADASSARVTSSWCSRTRQTSGWRCSTVARTVASASSEPPCAKGRNEDRGHSRARSWCLPICTARNKADVLDRARQRGVAASIRRSSASVSSRRSRIASG